MAKKIYIAELDAHTAKLEAKIDGLQNRTISAGQKMEGAFKRVGGALIAAFSAQQVFSFLKNSLSAYFEQEQAVKKLEIALGRTSLSLLNFATNMQRSTTFGDEAIINAMSMIAAFTKEEAVIKRLIKLSGDFASARQIDLATATDLVTKTFASSTNALSRYGLEVEGVAGSTDRLNSLTNALSIYLGQAEGEAQTTAGQFKQFNNALSDIEEGIGESISLFAGTGGLTDALYEVADAQQRGAEQWRNYWKAVKSGAGILSKEALAAFFGITRPLQDEADNLKKERAELEKTLKGSIEAIPWLKQQQDRLKEISVLINDGKLSQKEYTALKQEEQQIQDSLTIKKKEDVQTLKDTLDLYEEILQAQKQMDEDLLILGDVPLTKFEERKARLKSGGSAVAPAVPAEVVDNAMTVNDLMGNISGLSNQIASTLNIGANTFVAKLTEALSVGTSIVDIISGIVSIVSFFLGGGVVGAVAGLEKGGRVKNLFGHTSITTIPSFASGGSYTTPSYGGAYPVLVHKNETLDVYNSGQTSRMEKKLDGIRNAIMAGTLASTRKGTGGDSSRPIIVNIDGKKLFTINTAQSNRAVRSGKNLGDII